MAEFSYVAPTPPTPGTPIEGRPLAWATIRQHDHYIVAVTEHDPGVPLAGCFVVPLIADPTYRRG